MSTETEPEPLPPFLERVETSGTEPRWCHSNFGPGDPRSGWRWIDMPVYPAASRERGAAWRSTRKEYDLNFGEAGRALGVSAGIIGSMERGGVRSLDDAEVVRRYAAMTQQPVHWAQHVPVGDEKQSTLCGQPLSQVPRWTFWKDPPVTCEVCKQALAVNEAFKASLENTVGKEP